MNQVRPGPAKNPNELKRVFIDTADGRRVLIVIAVSIALQVAVRVAPKVRESQMEARADQWLLEARSLMHEGNNVEEWVRSSGDKYLLSSDGRGLIASRYFGGTVFFDPAAITLTFKFPGSDLDGPIYREDETPSQAITPGQVFVRVNHGWFWAKGPGQASTWQDSVRPWVMRLLPWLPLLYLAGPLLRLLQADLRVSRRQCPSCGYPRGPSPVCPECGRQHDESDESDEQPRS